MVLDYDLIKNILETVESQATNGFAQTTVNQLTNVNIYHYEVLIHEGLVDGSIVTTHYMGQEIPQEIRYKGLSMKGHQTLEALRNNTLWSKISQTAIQLGIEGLKQIPALAIKMMTP